MPVAPGRERGVAGVQPHQHAGEAQADHERVGGLRHRLRCRRRGAAAEGRGVIRIAISVEAFEAIASTLPLGGRWPTNRNSDAKGQRQRHHEVTHGR